MENLQIGAIIYLFIYLDKMKNFFSRKRTYNSIQHSFSLEEDKTKRSKRPSKQTSFNFKLQHIKSLLKKMHKQTNWSIEDDYYN